MGCTKLNTATPTNVGRLVEQSTVCQRLYANATAITMSNELANGEDDVLSMGRYDGRNHVCNIW